MLAASTSAMADRHVVFMYVWKCLTARLWTHYGKGGWRQAFALHDVYIVLRMCVQDIDSFCCVRYFLCLPLVHALFSLLLSLQPKDDVAKVACCGAVRPEAHQAQARLLLLDSTRRGSCAVLRVHLCSTPLISHLLFVFLLLL